MHGVQNKLFEVDPIHGDAPEFRNLEKLVKKRIDLFICEVSVCSDIIKKNPEKFKDLDYIDRPVGTTRGFHVGFSRKWSKADEFKKLFNKHLRKLKKNSVIKKIYEKYHIQDRTAQVEGS